MLKTNHTKRNYYVEKKILLNKLCKLYQPQGLEKIPKINKHRAFNKAVGPGKKC